tara:strand:- start:190 stop:303 length:114 start_codon:yes stop_codon:yes gene_type:complete
MLQIYFNMSVEIEAIIVLFIFAGFMLAIAIIIKDEQK